MASVCRTTLRSGVLLAAVVGSWMTTSSGRPAGSALGQPPLAVPGPVNVLYADPANLMYSSGPSDVERLLIAQANTFTANITATYNSGFEANPQAQAAFQAAADIWRSVISSPVPIRVSASFTDLGNPKILGAAGPTVSCETRGGVADTYYPAALADRLEGTAFCAAAAGAQSEITVIVNSGVANWDFGTSGAPVSGQYSLLTVALHEIGHGLGFYGSMSAADGVGRFQSVPYIFDRFAVTGGGASLTGFENPSAALGAQLLSRETFFDGPFSVASEGGHRPRLQARAGGNGLSGETHLDDETYSRTPDGLMTSALGQAEVYTDPGPIARAVLADLGWAATSPQLALDAPTNGSTVGPSFTVSGWAIDRGAASGTGIDAIHVYAYPTSGGAPTFLGVATYGSARPDVGNIFGSQFTNSGFSLAASGLAAGGYQITAFGRSTVSNSFSVAASAVVTVAAAQSTPAIALDAPTSNSTVGRTVTIAGWAIDTGSSTGTGVDTIHVWAYPSDGSAAQFLGVATYGLARSDVGSIFGSRFTNSGYRLSVTVNPGTYRIVAFARSTVANGFNAGIAASNVTVQASNTNAVLFVDTPGSGATSTRPFTISGWAVDSGATTGTGIDAVHVWAFPTDGSPARLVGAANYGLSRLDIGTLLGDARFDDSGFSFTADTSNLPKGGSYDLIVFGRSTVTGSFTVARVVRVTVPSQPNLTLRDASVLGFNKVGANVVFDVSDGTIGQAQNITVFNNSKPLDPASVQITATSVQANGVLQEGRNNIVVTGVTADDQYIHTEVTLWAGSRTLTATVRDEKGALATNATVTARLGDDQNVNAVATTTNGQVTFSNVPNRTINLTATASSNRVATLTTTGDAGTVQLSLTVIDAPSPIDNNDFSQGTNGWNVGSAPVTLILHQEDSSAAAVAPQAANYDLRLSTSGIGPKTISRTFKVRPGKKNVTVRYRFITSEVPGGYYGSQFNDSFSVTVRSEKGGGSQQVALAMNSMGRGAFDATGATGWRDLSLPVSVDGDVIQGNFTVTNVKDGLYDSQLVIDGITDKTLSITQRELKNINEEAPLKYLSGAAHTFYSGYTNIHGTLTIEGSADDSLTALSLEVLQFGKVVATASLAPQFKQQLPKPFGSTKKIQFASNLNQPLFQLSSAQAQNISGTNDSTLVLRLRANSANGEEDDPNAGPDKDPNAGKVELLVRYTGTNRYPPNVRDVGDCLDVKNVARWKCGGDDWLQPSAIAVNTAAAAFGVNLNDFSKMNGGLFHDHIEHWDGRDADGHFEGYDPANNAQATADKLIAILKSQYGTRIEKIYVTHKVGDVSDPFWVAIAGKKVPALGGGERPVSSVILHKPKHGGPGKGGHFHWRVLPPAGSGGTTLEITERFTP